jgi:hypothetical protein
MFEICPVDYTIVCRMLTLDFSAAFYAARLKLDHAVGINMDSLEGNALFTRLSSKGRVFIDGDFSNFDGKVNNQVKEATRRVIEFWYRNQEGFDPIHKIMRKALFESIQHVRHLVMNTIYETHCGIPSGHPLTVVVNSIINCLYMRIAWRSLAPEKLRDFETMDEHINFVVYGDDFVASGSSKGLEVFNRLTLEAFFRQHGIVFTPADKTGEITPLSPYTKTSFLKRQWIEWKDYNIVVTPLEEKTAMEEINWIREGGDEEDALRENVRNALQHLWGYGKSFYAKFQSRVNCELSKLGTKGVYISWDDIREQQYGI